MDMLRFVRDRLRHAETEGAKDGELSMCSALLSNIGMSIWKMAGSQRSDTPITRVITEADEHAAQAMGELRHKSAGSNLLPLEGGTSRRPDMQSL